MSRRLIIRPRAQLDLTEAALWYEDQRSGLGVQFTAELDRTLERIVDSPSQFPLVRRKARRALMRTFPYHVYFDLRGDQVVVLAVYHERRHPDGWKERRGSRRQDPASRRINLPGHGAGLSEGRQAYLRRDNLVSRQTTLICRG
jgi:plasmid stabilization system protein ParE